jgi:hypothetical protein
MSVLTTKRVRELYGMAVRWDSDEKTASIRESNLAEFDAWIEQHDREVRTKALHEAAEFVDSQRYIDEPADLRQVRDRLHSVADGTWEVEEP